MRSPWAIVVLALLAAVLAPGTADARRVHRLHLTSHADPGRAFPKRGLRRVARTSTLAPTWGCAEQTQDLAPLLSDAPQIKIVYAYASDGTDQLATGSNWGDLIQGDAQAVADRVAVESNNTKSVRFDVGGTGGSGGACTSDSGNRLDIETVQLSQTAATYNADDNVFRTVTGELRSKLKAADSHQRVNYVVYLDGIHPPDNLTAGQADLPFDTTHGYTNSINQGRGGNGHLFALVYGYGGTDFVGGDGEGSRRETFLHEMSHTLGAVQDNAPHSSGAGHCFDEQDVMCYDDKGPYFVDGGGSGDLTDNANCTGLGFGEELDCNNDDYFKADPAPGDFVAQFWNEWDSVFLCPVAECTSDLHDPNFAVTLSTSHPNGRLTLNADAGGAAVAHYEWNLNGDGTYEIDTGTTPSLVPVFSFPRASQVEVRAVKANGEFAYASMPLAPTDPVPSLKVTGQLVAGNAVTLDASATQDPDGLVERILWDTDGDGSLETDSGTARTVTTFPSAGSRQATVEVDYHYGFATQTMGFYVAEPAPQSQQTGTPPPPTGPLTLAGPALSAQTVRLRQLLAAGLPLVVTCSGACKVSLTLAIDARTARRFHLGSRNGHTVVIGRANAEVGPGTAKPALKLTARAKRALRRARSLKAKLAGSVQQRFVKSLTVAKSLTFKR